MVISIPETSQQFSNNLIGNRTYELHSDVSVGHLRRTSASTSGDSFPLSPWQELSLLYLTEMVE